jgi:hypothetical protein
MGAGINSMGRSMLPAPSLGYPVLGYPIFGYPILGAWRAVFKKEEKALLFAKRSKNSHPVIIDDVAHVCRFLKSNGHKTVICRHLVHCSNPLRRFCLVST